MKAKKASSGQELPFGFDRTAIVIPAYNESRFIGSVVIKACSYAATVIVVDDGSKDDTAAIAKVAGAIVLRHEKNSGKGTALATGFDYLRKHFSADVIVMIDGDGQHHCSEIPFLTQPILEDKADIAVGSRFLGMKSDIPKWRIFGQHALTWVTNLSARSPLTDSQSGFRALSRKILDLFPFDTEGFSVESEMQFVIQQASLRVIEVPISVVYEEPPKRNPVMQGLQVLNGIIRLISRYRPLFFFGGGGLLVLIIGLLWGWYVVDIYIRVRTLAIGYALISVLLTIIGSLSLFTGLLLHNLSALMGDIKRAIQHIQAQD